MPDTPTERRGSSVDGSPKKAGKIKTGWKGGSKKDEMRGRSLTRNSETTERLRRGLSQAQGAHAVDTMAQAACFSRRQFHRLMVQLLGETPGSHQRRLRLDRAAWLLLTSHLTVLAIALETGFESHETFTRAFRSRFDATPSAFRKNRGARLPRSIRLAFGIALSATSATGAVALQQSPDDAKHLPHSVIRH
jgi:AraC-like DNA-binding protein